MTRTDRLFAIASFVLAVMVLFVVVSVVGVSLGPLELIVVLVLSIPVGMLIGRFVRAILTVPRRSA